MAYKHAGSDLPAKNKYPKLVRDKIPVIIEREGKRATTHIAAPPEYLDYLLLKLVEEARELQEAEGEAHQKEEMADVREVLAAIQVALGILESDLADIQTRKLQERGGFEGRIILDEPPK